MNNRLYIWGDKTSKDRDYSSFISFTIDEIAASNAQYFIFNADGENVKV